MEEPAERCPWCGSAISREKFVEIQRAVEKEAEARLQRELAAHRKALEDERDRALLRAQAAFHREREAYQKKLREMERRLQRKTSHEMGEGAEIDLYETLRGAFPGDCITRIPKGQSGADLLFEVLHKGQSCGRILIESKNRQSWQNSFIEKLRADQMASGAEHAVLATTAFPAGRQELSMEDGVIVATPARVAHIVDLLRRAMVRTHQLGLSLQQRAGKMNRLYQYLTSPAYAQRFGELNRAADDLAGIDAQEAKEHQRVWKKRGVVIGRLRSLLGEIDAEVSAIVEGADEEPVPVARAG
jgi:hypothetical protein